MPIKLKDAVKDLLKEHGITVNDILDLMDENKIEIAEAFKKRTWLKEREIKSQYLIDKYVFYYSNAQSFLTINDNRDHNNFRFYILEDLEREIFLSCVNITTLKELQEKFPNVPEHELVAILNKFVEQGIIYREDDRYLSLPLNLRKVTNRTSSKEMEELLSTK